MAHFYSRLFLRHYSCKSIFLWKRFGGFGVECERAEGLWNAGSHWGCAQWHYLWLWPQRIPKKQNCLYIKLSNSFWSLHFLFPVFLMIMFCIGLSQERLLLFLRFAMRRYIPSLPCRFALWPIQLLGFLPGLKLPCSSIGYEAGDRGRHPRQYYFCWSEKMRLSEELCYSPPLSTSPDKSLF